MVIKLCDDGCYIAAPSLPLHGCSVYVVLQWKQHAGEIYIYIYNPGAQHLLLAVLYTTLHAY